MKEDWLSQFFQFDVVRECCVICARLDKLEWSVGWLQVWEYECELKMEGVGCRWRKALYTRVTACRGG